MTSDEVEVQFELKVKEERRVSVELIVLLSQIEQRRIHLERGYSSLFAFLTEKYKFSEGAANRRIAIARVIRDVPEVLDKVQSGDLNFTTVAKAYTFIKKAPAEKKREALKAIENQSTVKAEQILHSMFLDAEVKQERVTVASENGFQLNTFVSNEVMERFKQVRDLYSNTLGNASFVEVADHLFKKELAAQATATAAKRRVNSENKTITPRTKAIIRRPCVYKDERTGKVCGSTYIPNVDHIHPRALGGTNEESNLRSLCAQHNQLMAEKILGPH